jgi:YidC/Oxa1 family membrane protein insertase
MGPIDYLITNLTIPFLQFAYDTVYPNYGVAIILLTLVVKAAFYPLSHKQFVSMKKTQILQPELKKIQEKFKGQPEKLRLEMMKLWKEHKVNPLGGCLPALIQMPFFIAIFYTVKSETFQAILDDPMVFEGLFPMWLSNLTQPDATMIMPILIGVLTHFGQQLMTQGQVDPPLFMKFMPFIMVGVCFSMPSGVLIYWAVSQAVSNIQQYFVMKQDSSVQVISVS